MLHHESRTKFPALLLSLAPSTVPGHGEDLIQTRKKVDVKRRRRKGREGGRQRWRGRRGRERTNKRVNEWMNGKGQGLTEVIVPDFYGFCGSNTVHLYWGKWYRTVLLGVWVPLAFIFGTPQSSPLPGGMEPSCFTGLAPNGWRAD